MEYKYLINAIELIKWCRDEWNDIPSSERGHALDASILRLVQVRYMHLLMGVR